MKHLWTAGTFVVCLSAAALGLNSAALNLFAPLPASIQAPENPSSPAKVDLGRMLYYEPGLSRSQEISCNTCHQLDAYGTDRERVSTGHKGQKGTRNSPTVYNAAGHFVQFWDGRASTVEEQAKGPMTNPVEMAMASGDRAVAVLKSIPEYVAAFRKAFPDQSEPVTFDNAAAAIGAFERGLVTPARWDRFLKGDSKALTEAEKAGFDQFVSSGCVTCHNGAYVGGTVYQKLGLVKAWSGDSDPGRFTVTKQPADRGVFKVPSLRNVAETAPYFHTGTVETLDRAVALMAEYQTGRSLTPQQTAAIVAWLRSLTGEIPAEYIHKPALPRSTGQTPPPDRT